MKEDEFDKWVKTMQSEIMKEVKKIYSPIVINEWMHPSNIGRICDADAYAIITGPCGDTMEIYLKVKEDIISEATFMTDGCGATIACGSMITKMLINQFVDEAEKLEDAHLLKRLGGLPEENMHCATLTIMTMKKAIKKIQEKLPKIIKGDNRKQI